MGLPTRLKRSYLRAVYRKTTEEGLSLLRMLEDANEARYDSTASGKILMQTAGNGHSSGWELLADATPTQLAELWEELITRHEEATDALSAGASDAAIFAEMMDKLRRVTHVRKDYRALRTGPEVPD